MSGLKSLKKNSKVDIMLEKWQERLIPSQDTEQFGQGGTSVPAEGDPAALAQAEEVARVWGGISRRMGLPGSS